MTRRSFLLLEVVLALALLAAMAALVVKIQHAAIQQANAAQRQRAITAQVESLLWEWSRQRVPVTLPSTGQLAGDLTWRREVTPQAVAPGVLATRVTVTIWPAPAIGPPLLRVDWLVPAAEQRR